MADELDKSTPSILVVDDNRANLLAFEAVLSPLGCRIVGANSGAEALERLLHQDFVMILMDVHMPGLDGYQTTALIRERPRSRDVPVIFVTAVYGQPEHTQGLRPRRGRLPSEAVRPRSAARKSSRPRRVVRARTARGA